MGEADNGRRSKAMENLSLPIDKYPRDLLQRFMFSSDNMQKSRHEVTNEESEDIELNLGLSLGGRFGVDKTKKLIRSSSVLGTMPLMGEEEATATPPQVLYPTITRTSSLPMETEEEWRKRKELQTLGRMEAKRRRFEKQRNTKVEKEDGGGGSAVAATFGLASWAGGSSAVVLGDGLAKGKVGFHGIAQPTSQGSVDDSQGGSSLGMSEMESKPINGPSGGSETRSPARNPLLPERSNQEAMGSSSQTMPNKNITRISRSDDLTPFKRPNAAQTKGREEIGKNSLEDMPCVFTKGDGPNGRRIEGILYKYGKGEEVRIMCICHGNFLSPAEFVKHAGGGDADYPLRHIVINPSSASSTSFL